ncbi:MAG TPA: hypothetical protein VFP72_19625 [Kineosporiaceae bacterium]|nr:hypothetical protein [Kineosporiaceae bacterium]
MPSPARFAADLAALTAGAVVVCAVGTSLIRTLLIPRGRPSPLVRCVDRAVDGTFRTLTRPLTRYGTRDTVLAAQAPTTLLLQLLTWLALAAGGFALLLLPVTRSPHTALREAASSLLTLGFTSTHGWWATVTDAAAAVTGLVVIALQIAYLPMLYGAFNRRETDVTLLAVRAGEPAWGPELLARTHFGFLGMDLATFYGSWERWAADIAESHVSYPVLLRFRSPRPLGSWLVGLVAVLDAAAMHLATCPQQAPVQARLCLRMGFICLRRLARATELPVDEDPRPDGPLELGEDEFREGYQRLVAIGFPVERSAEQAWPHFRGWRVNYEAAAYALARELDAVPARWTGPRRWTVAPLDPVRPPNRTPEDPGGSARTPADA